jgi:hypothetical protein
MMPIKIVSNGGILTKSREATMTVLTSTMTSQMKWVAVTVTGPRSQMRRRVRKKEVRTDELNTIILSRVRKG